MQQMFFGPPENPLFGVYHKPKTSGGNDKAVVICPPIGQEYIRTHWSLRLLANQLSRRGVHVFRFDFLGLGDSAGDPSQVENLQVWENNIRAAIRKLMELSGARSVMLLGQRMGGLLAAQVALDMWPINSVVLWEPTLDGSQYLSELRQMHRKMVDLWFNKTKTVSNNQYEEVLGFKYSRSLLKQIEETRFDCQALSVPQFVVDRTANQELYPTCEWSLRKVVLEEQPNSWTQFSELEIAYLNPELTRIVVAHVNEMFDRLKSYGALDQGMAGVK